MKTKLILVLILSTFCLFMKSQFASSNFTLVSNIDPEPLPNSTGEKYSGCWGWYQPAKNKEYAIACSQTGTYWIDVTNPVTPTVSAYEAGAHTNAIWREAKTYQNYCYVVSDDPGTNSLQIIDMQNLPNSVNKIYDSQALFKRGHTLWVDGNKLYVSSVTYSNGSYSSLDVYSLVNPANPVLLRRLDQDYPFINSVHDVYSRNDTVFASCAYQGLYVFKFTPSNTFLQIGSLTSYPSSGYNHSSALTPNGQTLVFADEVPNSLPIKVANVSNISNIQITATTNQYPQTTPHNPFIVNNQYCFMSSYAEGLQLYDIANPTAPFLAGYFDTYPQGGGNVNNWGNNAYVGQWGCYPFLPSKTIFALDMQNGVFLLRTSLYQNPAVSATFSPVSPLCAGLTMSLTNTSTGAINYTWTFSGGTPTISTVANPTVSFTSPGIHTITLLASNPSYSASTSQTINVPVNNSINTTITTTNSACGTCSTGIASASLSGGIVPYTYTWQPSGGNSNIAQNLAARCYTLFITDAAKCSSSATACIGFFTGLNQNSLSKADVLVYPNPAHNLVTVESATGISSCSVYDISGKLILVKNSHTPVTILHLEKLPAGIYLLEVTSEKEKTRKKLIIE